MTQTIQSVETVWTKCVFGRKFKGPVVIPDGPFDELLMIPAQTLWLIHWNFYQYVKDILILFWTLKGRTRLKFTWILDLNLLWHYMGCGNSFEGVKDSRLSQLERVDADTSDYFIEPKLLLIWCWTIFGNCLYLSSRILWDLVII